MAETKSCKHCGTPFLSESDEEFCCAGCAHVHQLIEERGLEKFYSLRGRAIEPVSPAVSRPADFEWLRAAVGEAEKTAEVEGRAAQLSLDVKGISCVGCVWLLEELFRKQSGGRRFSVNPQSGRAELEWRPGVFSPVKFAEEVRRFGYRFAPRSGPTESDSGPLLSRLGICAFLALNTMLFTLPGYLGMEKDFPFADLFGILTVLFASISFGVGGLWFVGRAWDAARMGVLHIDLPIALGVSAAWGGSIIGWLLGREDLVYFDFVAIFIFLMLTGRWLQERSIERNRARAQALDPAATTYQSLVGNERLAAGAIRPEHRFSLEPGQTLPVRSVLENGPATFSLENMNGESDGVSFETSSRVPSGAILTSSDPAHLRAEETWKDSLLFRLTNETGDPPRNLLLERILVFYTGLVIALAVLGGTAWGVFGDVFSGLQVAISVLVVSCPCSLGIAWPLINDIAAGRLRRHGVYLREGDLWGRLDDVKEAVFDKTGTLTLENPTLTDPSSLDRLGEPEKSLLLSLVESSFHPVGRTLREELLRRGVRSLPPDSFTEIAGQGVVAAKGSEEWTLGKAGWKDAEDEADGATVFARNGEVLTRFVFTDSVRQQASEELQKLADRGLGLAILSGDRQEKVDTLASGLPIPRERALGGLSPEAKAQWIEKNAKGSALMIGDGANDALAFSRALCRGTPLLDKGLLESRCDFFFTGRDLSGIRHLFETGVLRARILRQVFTFAAVYNVAAIALCLFGWMNPLLAAILMPSSALLTVARASRMRRR
ncbi:heavy metal translocating P-type ATPase metal-binding domain-containing protein [Puniceicoccus vermicola]|uniref:Heavy metal translocating P-type ATPase metal-binding domain-containing protein n=1 Tax=Puniceicoccus vermicola TaxID=388746 RepID=A0A7X1AXE2_9BACT|nr:heavy metal translocating P-type ATPase metal-binding domain-containing protein [Puniceicoccus vermicola]